MTTASVAGGRTRTVLALGGAQTLAWASSYYLPAMLAVPMARDTGVETPTVFAVFSMALIISALAGPLAGRLIDHHGGRPVLMATNVAFAAGLVLLGLASGPRMLIVAWVVLGLAMGFGLYEAAFAALVRLYGSDSRNVITGITLLGGLASTVGWPLSAWLEVNYGWRTACLVWAGLHALVGLPLNALLQRAPRAPGANSGREAHTASVPGAERDDRTRAVIAPIAAVPVTVARATDTDTDTDTDTAPIDAPIDARIAPVPPDALPPAPRHAAALLSVVFTLVWFVSTAMAAHLPAMMQAAGGTLALAVAVGALVGPAQVAGRLFEFGLLRRFSPLAVARAATLGHPIGALLLLTLGTPAAFAFAVLHGLGNGILTIAKGTLPLALFGPAGYGARQGWIALPGRMLQGLAPWLFGIALSRWGIGALWLSSALGLAALGALLCLRLPVAEARVDRRR